MASMTDATMTDPTTKPPRSKSRQRTPLSVMLTPTERAKVEADAAALGLSLSGYCRTQLLGAESPRTQRKPIPEQAATIALRNQVQRVGGNLAQLLKLANAGAIINPPELETAINDIRALIARIREAFGYDH
jgi:hypothetical protein